MSVYPANFNLEQSDGVFQTLLFPRFYRMSLLNCINTALTTRMQLDRFNYIGK